MHNYCGTYDDAVQIASAVLTDCTLFLSLDRLPTAYQHKNKRLVVYNQCAHAQCKAIHRQH